MGWKDNIEDTFTKWSKRASDKEETKCEHALSMFETGTEDEQIKNLDISFIPQGFLEEMRDSNEFFI